MGVCKMSIVKFPSSPPVLFWIVAIVWCVYQGYAGFQYGLFICDTGRKNIETKPYVRVISYGLHHGAFYCLCSISGFAAWRIADWVSKELAGWSQIISGTGALPGALTLISVTGISGGLARLLFLGKNTGM